MDRDEQLKLQAYLDGELPEAEARVVANWLAQDKDAVALLGELRHTRQALAGFETGVSVPESREFYWSKIEREINGLEAPARESARVPFLARLRRALVPATALAGGLLAALLYFRPGTPPQAEMETAMTDPEAITFQDFDSGTTVVWFSYPAEKEFAKDKPAATIQ